MFTFSRRGGIIIPNYYKDQSFYNKIKSRLIRRNKDYSTGSFVVVKFFLEHNENLLIPRFFPLEEEIENFEIIDNTSHGEDIDIYHKIVPRNKTQKRAIEYLLSSERGILELEPGVGKTVITIFKIASIKKKTMILVHRDSLAEQWKGIKDSDPPQGILSFTNLQENDISRLSSSTFLKDLEKPIIIATDQTFISLLKRNRNKFIQSLKDANIGYFVGDEVHTTIGAPTFSECSIHIPSFNVNGLSATPYRYDGNGDIIEYHLGPVYSDEEAEGTMDANVTVLLLDYQIDIPKRRIYLHWEGQFQRARYLNLIYKSKTFLSNIKGMLSKLQRNRDLIVICERIKLVDLLYNWVSESSKSKFTGNAQLDKLNYKVVFATPQKMRDGIDAPHKDCVIMTSPISNIKQLAGRVVRSKEGKKTPIIIDMVDYGCEDIRKTFFNRLKFYQTKKWNINFVLISNNKIFKIDEDQAVSIIKGD